MTSRERVKTSFAHKQPDKMAVDFGGFCCSQINAQVVGELRKYYGLKEEPVKILDMATMTGIIEPDLADIMMSDVQMLDQGMMRSAIRTITGRWSYQGETVPIPGDCELSDDGNGGYYVYPRRYFCETERTYAGKWFLL